MGEVYVKFDTFLPPIRNALEVNDAEHRLVLEVEQHLSYNTARTFPIGSTHWLLPGQKVWDTGAPSKVAVGSHTLGRIMNVTGEPIDDLGPIIADKRSIYCSPPNLINVPTTQLVTGIKAIDLLFPLMKGQKIGLF